MSRKFEGDKIKKMRLEKGITQKDFASLVGISNSYLSDIEIGRTSPSLKTLLKIAEALDVEIDMFLEKSS